MLELDSFSLTLSNILNRIDEYSLYCHYLGFDPDIRGTYSSPIREGDEKPSFSFYNARPGSDIEFMWKDGAVNKSGTIVHLVMELYGIPYNEALAQIDVDFNLGLTDGTYKSKRRELKRFDKPKAKGSAKIEIRRKSGFTRVGLAYWEQFGINKETLIKYQVSEIYMAVINGKYIRYNDLAFAYRVADKYKIYQPKSTQFKFINNFDHRIVEGFFQLEQKQDLLIITKSLKDVMTLHELGYEAISPKSESTVIPDPYFKWINERYKRVIVLFDNDMKHNGDLYPYRKVYIPLQSGCKDISDYVKKYGKKDAKHLVSQLIK